MAGLFVYRNLHTGGFSIKQRGRVIARVQRGVAYDVTFKVNEGGRQRVIQEQRKNVHSYVVAKLFYDCDVEKLDPNLEIYYNPYKQSTFTLGGIPIYEASSVIFKDRKCYLNEKCHSNF